MLRIVPAELEAVPLSVRIQQLEYQLLSQPDLVRKQLLGLLGESRAEANQHD